MAHIGQLNHLQVVKQVDFGVYLDGEELGNILLPRRYVPENCALGDRLGVFVYLDSEDYLIATTLRPLVMVGQCAYLKVKEVNEVGAFLDWGLPKDLMVPFSEQHKPFEEGKSYVVTVYLDPYTDRIVASSKLNKHLDQESHRFQPKQAVDLLICGRTEMGYKAVINHTHQGLIFRDDAFKPLQYGMKLGGYIKAIRADGKIDVSLQLPASLAREELTEQIIAHLKAHGGTSTLTDKAPPEEIYRIFNVSKGNYKNALGKLYKQRRILIDKQKITLL